MKPTHTPPPWILVGNEIRKQWGLGHVVIATFGEAGNAEDEENARLAFESIAKMAAELEPMRVGLGMAVESLRVMQAERDELRAELERIKTQEPLTEGDMLPEIHRIHTAGLFVNFFQGVRFAERMHGIGTARAVKESLTTASAGTGGEHG